MATHDANITRRGDSWRVELQLGRGADRTRRIESFPLDQKDRAIAWRDATRETLHRERLERGVATPGRGAANRANATIDADVVAFLATIADRGSDCSHLRAWLAAVIDVSGQPVRFGTLTRAAIQADDTYRQLVILGWKKAPSPHLVRTVRVVSYARDGRQLPAYERKAPATSGRVVSALTIRHRDRMLRELCAHFKTPLPYLKAVPPRPKPHPHGVSIDVILAVARNLARETLPRTLVHRYRSEALRAAALGREAARQQRALLVYVRYLVIVSTAQRPCQVMRARPEDLNFAAGDPDAGVYGVWTVRAAKGEPAHTVNLSLVMRRAWEQFIAADGAWGSFQSSAYGKAVHKAGWPRGVRPYNAKHSFALDTLARDPSAMHKISAHFGHASIVTTETFYAGRVPPSPTDSILEDRLADLFRPVAVK